MLLVLVTVHTFLAFTKTKCAEVSRLPVLFTVNAHNVGTLEKRCKYLVKLRLLSF